MTAAATLERLSSMPQDGPVEGLADRFMFQIDVDYEEIDGVRKLRIYTGAGHPHTAQKPEPLDGLIMPGHILDQVGFGGQR